MFFFACRFLISNWILSATITSWESFRTTAPMYFFMGNPFPIDLWVFEHSNHRLEWVEVITSPLHNGEFSEISLIFIDFHWISLIFIEFHWFSIDFHWFSATFRKCFRICWWPWLTRIDSRNDPTLLKHSKMDSRWKNTSELCCGSSTNSQ